MLDQIRPYAKFAVAVAGAALASFSQFIPLEYQEWITAGIAFITAIGVYATENKEPAPTE